MHRSATLALVLLPFALAGNAGATTVAFDTYPGGAPVPPGATIFDQWQSVGVVFSDGSGGAVGASNNSCSLTAPNHAYAATIVARFVDPATGTQALTAYAGTAQDNCWVPGEGIAMRAYGIHNELLGSQFNSGAGNFVAFSFPSAVIARLEMDCILQGIDNFTFDAPTTVDVGAPAIAFALARPASPTRGGRLTIDFSLPGAAPARLDLFDVAGRLVTSVELEYPAPGRHQARLGEARPIPAGIHFVRLTQGSRRAVARVVLLP